MKTLFPMLLMMVDTTPASKGAEGFLAKTLEIINAQEKPHRNH